jgi:hypothetical protein
MFLFMAMPLQAVFGLFSLIVGVLYFLVILFVIYHVVNISRNTDQIAADMERIATRCEDFERRENEDP